ncbi:hypothetical protein [Bradyrhizobium sp. RDM4]|uniref:hypothetical protein n=1 Tax=Bradyrhizobium sp. RDM4 TaxID=3378765 RepID=UPI0038FD24A1
MSLSTLEFNAMLLDPIYDAIGVPARIILTSGRIVDVTVVDNTDGITINEGQFVLETIRPVLAVRQAELASNSIAPAEISDGQVVMDRGSATEKTWRIKVIKQNTGELQLVLLDEAGA